MNRNVALPESCELDRIMSNEQMQRSQDSSKQYHTEVHKVLNKMHIPKDIWKYLQNTNHVSMLRGLRELIVRIISISPPRILVDLIGLCLPFGAARMST